MNEKQCIKYEKCLLVYVLRTFFLCAYELKIKVYVKCQQLEK